MKIYPYVMGRPVSGVNFYGRERLISRLIGPYSAGWKWLCAPRRIGKTSVLQHVERIVRERGTQVLFFDFQQLLDEEKSGIGFLQALIDQNRKPLSALGIEARDFQKDTDGPRALQRLVEQITERGSEILLLIDEAEGLIELEERERGFLSRLRGYLHARPHFEMIITGSQVLAELYGSALRRSDFLGAFSYIPMGALDETAARALLLCTQTESWQTLLPGPAVARILDYSGGHPFVLQWVGTRLSQRLEFQGAALKDEELSDCFDALPRDRIMLRVFEDDYTNLTARQRRMLSALCEHATLCADELTEHLGLPKDEVKSLGEDLAEFGYITTGDRYRLRYSFYKQLRPRIEPRFRVEDAAVARNRSDAMTKPRILAFYCRADEEAFGALSRHLKPADHLFKIESFTDDRHLEGESAGEELAAKLEQTTAALLFLSPSFLASSQLSRGTVPRLLAHAAAQNLRVCPVYVLPILPREHLADRNMAALLERQGLNSPSSPLAGAAPSLRESILVDMVGRLLSLLGV